MATWEDGPEYAPLERPDGFSYPDVPPLEQAPRQQPVPTGAPLEQPQFRVATNPGPPLDSLVPTVTDRRDPNEPFNVLESTMTANTSAWAGAHWSQGQGNADAVSPQWGPPTPGIPAAQPGRDAIQLTHQHQAAQPGGFPAPGTVDWFAPPPAGSRPAAGVEPRMSIPQALTVGYILVLAVSVIYVLAPFTLVIGGILSRQVKVAQATVRKLAVGAISVWVLIVLITIIMVPLDFGSWWAHIGLAAAVVALVLLFASSIVVRGRQPDQNASRSNWG